MFLSALAHWNAILHCHWYCAELLIYVLHCQCGMSGVEQSQLFFTAASTPCRFVHSLCRRQWSMCVFAIARWSLDVFWAVRVISGPTLYFIKSIIGSRTLKGISDIPALFEWVGYLILTITLSKASIMTLMIYQWGHWGITATEFVSGLRRPGLSEPSVMHFISS